MTETPGYIITIDPTDHVIYGADKISKIIKRHRDDLASLVESGELKAWKETGAKGKWKALCTDLLAFNISQRDKNVKKTA